jgi:thiamine-monophosphate kinase
MLALTLPYADKRFVEAFAEGFAQVARAHAVSLIGGDTTQGPLSVTVSAFGFLPESRALLRSGARVGDAVFVTGTLGDAAAALRLMQDAGLGTRDPANEQARSELAARLNRPEPRIAAGLALRDVASACIDVSDGLLADLGHICEASGMGAIVEADALPLSSAMFALFEVDERRAFALSGGDDYELCFTASVDRADRIAADFARLGFGAARIGRIVAEPGVRVRDANGKVVEPPRRGWQHFAP